MPAVNTYIPFDLLKPNNTLIDITPNFNGRVGDSQSYIKIWFKSNGLPFNLGDNVPYFEGVDPTGLPFQVYGTADANQAGDSWQTGRVTFYFPAEVFQNAGTWDLDSTFFGIKDSAGKVISTVNVTFNVLENKVEMGGNYGPFITDLEKIKTQGTADIQQWITDTKADVDAALTDVTDPNSSFNLLMTAAKKQLDVLEAQIAGNDYVTETEFADIKTQIANALASLDPTLLVGTMTLADGSDYYPSVHAYVYTYGAGVAQTTVDIAGGSTVYDVDCRAERVTPTSVKVYVNANDIKQAMSDFTMTSATVACGNGFAYLNSGVYGLAIEAKGATVNSFTIDTGFKI